MKRLLLILLFIISAYSSPIYASFEIWDYSVKGTALNHAYSALGDDATVILYNPALIPFLNSSQLSLNYSKPMHNFTAEHLHMGSLFFAIPLYRNGWAGGYTFYKGIFDYSERMGYFSYAVKVGNNNSLYKLGLGGNLKILTLETGEAGKDWDPALKTNQSTKPTFDLGALIKLGLFRFGLSALNLTSPNLGRVEKSKLPREVRVGVGMERITSSSNIGVSSALECVYRNHLWYTSLGIQINPFPILNIYLGGSKENISCGLRIFSFIRDDDSNRMYTKIRYILDLSYLFPRNPGIECTPHIGLTMEF